MSASRRRAEEPRRSAVGWEANDHVLAEEVFDTRVLNCCIRANVVYLGEFRKKTVRELLKVRGWGRKAVLEVQRALEDLELPPLRDGGP